MDPHEKFNAGRFFTGWYGARHTTDNGRAFDSMLLLSNDMLSHLQDQIQKNAESDKGLSKINTYIAAALSTICNGSSQGTHSVANFDPIEMNNRLNGHPVIVGFSYARVDAGTNDLGDVLHLQKLFSGALCNPTLTVEGQVVGLSVPVVQDESARLTSALNSKVTDFGSFERKLDECHSDGVML